MSNLSQEVCCGSFDLQKWIPDFLIDDAKRTALCFREALIISPKNEFANDASPIGSYCILVETFGPCAREFLVYVQSSITVDGYFGGTKVISSATEKFHCLQEKRTEFLHRDDGEHKKVIFIGDENNSYYIKLTRICPRDQTSTQKKDLPFCCGNKFISEGVSILLMRYLALINYQGSLSLQSITMEGDVVLSQYDCTPAKYMEVDDHYLNICTIERKIFKEDDSVHISKTYLTRRGRIIRHNWHGVPYTVKFNPLEDFNITPPTPSIGVPLFDDWSEDIEMFSMYLNAKHYKMAQRTEYLVDHPEIKQIIADYSQALLIAKPADVLDFTLQYFKAFAQNPGAFEPCIPEKNIDTIKKLPKKGHRIAQSKCRFFKDKKLLRNEPKEICGENSCESIERVIET